MLQRTLRGVLLALLLTLPPAFAKAQDAIEPDAKSALAWHFDSMSDELLRANKSEAAFRLSAALLDAAGRLDPQESRFPRLRTLALVQLGDIDGAINALIAYRTLRPGDTPAQVQLVDLYASTQQTLDAKVKYLGIQVGNAKLSPEVRAVLAIEVATLLAQKSPEEAAKMAGQAMQIYPLPEVTRQNYRYTGSKLPLPQRIASLLEVLKADPNQPAYMHELAALLASNGMSQESLIWYDGAVELSAATGRSPGFHALLIDYIAQQIIAGKPALADSLIGQILNGSPLDADGWLFRLTLDKDAPKAVFGQSLDMARSAFVRRWNALGTEIVTGKPEPAQAPKANGAEANPTPIDAAPVIAKLTTLNQPNTTEAVAAMAGDFAWLELYFAQDAQAATHWIELYRSLEGDNTADANTLTRLGGWQALVGKDPQKAKDIFLPIADKDPLSQMGLIEANKGLGQPVDLAEVQKLLDNNRIGLASAMIWSAYRAAQFQPKPNPLAPAVTAELNKFPQQLLKVLNRGQANAIYSLRAEPLESRFTFGAPVLAQVTVQNVSSVDLTIGGDSLLRPELSFDAKILGGDSQVFPSVAYDTLSGQIVLRPNASAGQIVRLDVGKLRTALYDAPGAVSEVNGDVVSNPIAVPAGNGREQVGIPGPGGTGANFFRTFKFAGIPIALPAGRDDLNKLLTSKSEVDRLHAADLVAAYIRISRANGAPAALRQAAADLPNALDNLRKDANPIVAAWAGYVLVGLSSPNQLQAIIDGMSESTDWSTRLLSLLASRGLAPDERKALIGKMANDADPSVKAAAGAIAELNEQLVAAPATQPAATQPTTLPAATQPAAVQ